MADPQFSLQQNAAVSDEDRVTYFAVTDTRGKHVPFGIKRRDRDRHTYVIGKTGMGKSTLLENMAIQDIQRGEGMCFIDPHGGTAEKLLEYIPAERAKDVLYFAPFDMQYPISFNVLEDVDADKRHFVVAGLMSTFEKIWVDAWSARMAYILQNTLAALLEFPGATLLGVNRMYIDKEYRKNVIANITDPAIRSFWVDEYTKYTDRYAQEATPAIQNKIGQFASNALVRNIIGQPTSAFNIRELMDKKKIFIANLSKGRVGEGNANLLGSMIITKVYLAAMSRADAPPSEMRTLPPFYLYVDEFQNFANRSFADILSEARKYKLALTVAHQYIEQMEEEVRAAVFGNVGTMMTFRVGSYDAEVLEKEFAPVFTADDLVNLGRYQLYLKLMIDGVSSQPFSASTMTPIAAPEVSHRDRTIAFSRAQFARPRAEVEAEISEWTARRYVDPDAEEKERARDERRAARDVAEGSPPRDRAPFERRTPVGPGPRAPRSEGQGVWRANQPRRVETRVDRAPQEGPPQRVGAPAGERSAPRRSLPPRPAPVRTDVPRGGLRNILERVAGGAAVSTPPPRPKSDVVADAPTTTQPAGASQQTAVPPSRPQASSSPQPRSAPPARDDGKSVTVEGKEQLRSLLNSLTKQKQPKEADASTSARPSSGVRPTPAAKKVPRANVAPSRTEEPEPVVVAPRPSQAETLEEPTPTPPVAPQPAGVPDGELSAMLDTRRPPNLQ